MAKKARDCAFSQYPLTHHFSSFRQALGFKRMVGPDDAAVPCGHDL